MADNRLTRGFRDSLVQKITFATFDLAKKELAAKQIEFFKAFIEQEIGADLAVFKSLSKSWFPELTYLQVNCSPIFYGFYVPKGKGPKVPYHLANTSARNINNTNPLYSLYELIYCTEKQIKKDEKDLRTKLYTILNSVNTLPRLREVWPDIDKYVPKTNIVVKPITTLPAVLTSEVENLINKYPPIDKTKVKI